MLYRQNYSDITRASWFYQIIATQLFVQQLVHDNSKANIKVLYYWPFVWGIHQWLVDSPHKGPIMQKAIPCLDVIMIYMLCLCCTYFHASCWKKLFMISYVCWELFHLGGPRVKSPHVLGANLRRVRLIWWMRFHRMSLLKKLLNLQNLILPQLVWQNMACMMFSLSILPYW